MIKDLMWCASAITLIVVVTICLLLLGVAIGEGVKPTPKEKVVTCVPSGRGFYKCSTEWV